MKKKIKSLRKSQKIESNVLRSGMKSSTKIILHLFNGIRFEKIQNSSIGEQSTEVKN